MEILNEESHLEQIVKLVGPDALPDEQRVTLETSRLLREGFLQQNALDDIDTYATPRKQLKMLSLILHFHERAMGVVRRGAVISSIQALAVVNTLIRMKAVISNDQLDKLDEIGIQLDQQMDELEALYR
jgi:V/A-type H+-transporting ATPase subunit A